MLGWHIIVHTRPSELVWTESKYSVNPDLTGTENVATWDASLGGLRWVDELVESGEAKCLATNGGYPIYYEVRTRDLVAILPSPPGHRFAPVRINDEVLESAGEWVIVDAWDES